MYITHSCRKSAQQINREAAYKRRDGRSRLFEIHGSSDKRLFNKALENFDRPAYTPMKRNRT